MLISYAVDDAGVDGGEVGAGEDAGVVEKGVEGFIGGLG